MEKMVMILITGGTGFLGGRLASFINKKGYQVRIGTRKYKKNIHNYLTEFEIVEMDLFDKKTLLDACLGVDVIIHLADLNAQEAQKYPQQAIQTNGVGTFNLLNAACEMRVKKIIYFSTIHVYGNALTGDVSEKTVPFPIHPYGIASRLAEDIILHSQSKMNSVVLRLSNVVGSPMSSKNKCWHLIANDLCRQTIENGKLQINSNPNIERDFVPLTSLLEVCHKLIKSDLKNKDIWGQIFNISSGKALSLGKLATQIAQQSETLFKNFYPIIKFLSFDNNKLLNRYTINSNKAEKTELLKKLSIKKDLDDLLIQCNRWFN